MQDTSQRTAKTIRIKGYVYHLARVAAVMSRTSLGQWLESAILEKLSRERYQTPLETNGKDHGLGN